MVPSSRASAFAGGGAERGGVTGRDLTCFVVTSTRQHERSDCTPKHSVTSSPAIAIESARGGYSSALRVMHAFAFSAASDAEPDTGRGSGGPEHATSAHRPSD